MHHPRPSRSALPGGEKPTAPRPRISTRNPSELERLGNEAGRGEERGSGSARRCRRAHHSCQSPKSYPRQDARGRRAQSSRQCPPHRPRPSGSGAHGSGSEEPAATPSARVRREGRAMELRRSCGFAAGDRRRRHRRHRRHR